MNEREDQVINEYIQSKCKEESSFAEKVNQVKAKLNNTVLELSERSKFIVAQAREYLKSQNGMVEDATVFNWAYDFYNDYDMAKQKIAKPVEVSKSKETSVETKKEKAEEPVKVEEKTAQPALKKLRKDFNDEIGQISLFD